MKERPKAFLAEIFTEPQSLPEVADYIQELHEYLWRFVRAELPFASGNLSDYVMIACRSAEWQAQQSRTLDDPLVTDVVTNQANKGPVVGELSAERNPESKAWVPLSEVQSLRGELEAEKKERIREMLEADSLREKLAIRESLLSTAQEKLAEMTRFRDDWMRLAEEWEADYDKLKNKYEPSVLSPQAAQGENK